MDGTARIILHSGGLSVVYGLTLDYENQILYWADYSRNRIEMSFTNGSNRAVLTSSGSSPTRVTAVTGSLGQDPYGIHVVTKERQPDGECKDIQ